MECPQCQHENPDGSRFCNSCGAKLNITCSVCEHINLPGSRFCNACGHNLADASSSQLDIQPTTEAERSLLEPSIPEAERRQLTVMFCDLVESTALSGQLDPEDLRDVIRAYQTACTEVIGHFEGYVAQLLGDGLLVYFGYPQAHEDDAQRAVRAGLGIIEAIGALNTQLEQAKDIRLAVRLGIHTGLVVVGEMGGEGRQEQLALGETPNIASRIQGFAKANTIAISHATYRLVQGYFDFQELGEQELRGVSQPVAVYQVFGESSAWSRLDIASTRGLTPLVGRESEVSLLLERWEQVKDGQGQVILLSGEAGIGKSRLVQVLKDHVADEPHTLQECRCSPYHTHSAFFPLADLMQRKLGWQPEDTADEKLHKLETVLAQTHLDVNQAVPLFTTLLSLPLPDGRYPALPLSSQWQRQQTLEALLQLILLAAEPHPVLFVVEDLHWIDPSTLEFLDLLLDQTPTAAIFVLFTCRPEFQPSWSHRSYLTEISLHRLSQLQVERMVERMTDDKALPPEVLQHVVEKTDGVPLFVEEMTKVLLESSHLQETNGRYELTASLPPAAIPVTLQDSLMARLDSLVTAKGAAQIGATIGRQFSYELLQAILQLDEATLQRELGRLVKAELVYQRGLPPQATYFFKHALIQDTAYQSLLRNTRQQYHQRIAQVLEEQFPETAETQPELLAHHCTEAGLYEQAIEHWQRAGENAIQRSANVEAIAQLTKVLELLTTLPATPERASHELDVLTTLGPVVRIVQGDGALDVQHIYTRAQELCQQLDDTLRLFSVLRGLYSFYTVRAQYEAARELGEQLLTTAQDHHDPSFRLEAYRALGLVLFYLGEFSLSHTHLEQGIALYNYNAHRHLAFRLGLDLGVACLSPAAWTLWMLGYPDQAWHRSQEALRLAQEVSHPYTLGWALNWAMRLHQCRRESQVVQEQAETAMVLCAEQGFKLYEAGGGLMQGWVLTVQGQAEQGTTQMLQSLTSWRATGAEVVVPYFLALLAEAYGKRGQIEEGLAALAEALTLVEKNGERYDEAEIHRLKGELLLALSSDNHDEAETCFHQAITIAQSQQAKSWELRAVTSLARLWQQQDKHQDAHKLLAPVYEWFTEGFDTADLMDARSLLDELSAEKMPPTA